jgi:hypothetical protein
VHGHGSAENVYDRICRAHFVKVHVIEGHTMYGRFDLGETAENFQTRVFDGAVKLAPLYQMANLFPGTGRFVLPAPDLELQGANAVNVLFRS